MKSVSLRTAIKLFGGEVIKMHRLYCEESGFFKKDGQLFYINSGDVRLRRQDGQLNVMYRTARDERDFTGGINQWGFVNALNKLGYRVVKCSYKTNGN